VTRAYQALRDETKRDSALAAKLRRLAELLEGGEDLVRLETSGQAPRGRDEA